MKNSGLFRRAMATAFLVVALVSIVGSPIAYAQGGEEAAANQSDAVKIAIAQKPVWHYFGAALGLGLVVMGAAMGIGKFAAAAAEGIARQPAAAAQISGAVSLPLFLLEGVAIIAEVVVLLVVLLR
jgi:F-type H+-transporting ATPase subunit c